MKQSHLKYYVGIILIMLVDSLHNVYFEDNRSFDVYLFYDHERYLTNILFDISNLFKFSLLTLWMIKISRIVFIPLFCLSIMIWISYFVNYNQIGSLLIIPVYLLIVFLFKIKVLS